MTNFLVHFLYPGEHNNFRPHYSRTPFLLSLLGLMIGVTLINSIFFSSRPKILGFATNIYVNEIIEDTNRERQKLGLSPVTENITLDKIALEKGKDMFAKNYWAHASPEGVMPWSFFQKDNYHYLYAGENLARDFYTSSAVVAAWMNSPSHRENLLGRNYKEIGVAVLNGKFDNNETTLVVQMFGTPLEVGLAEKQPEVKTASFNTSPVGSTSISNLPLGSLGLTQKIYLVVSIVLLSFFLFDSFVLLRTRRQHNRHPFFHTVLLASIIVVILYLNRGLVI